MNCTAVRVLLFFSRLDVQLIFRLVQLHWTHQSARLAKDKNWYASHKVMSSENKCTKDDDIGQEGFHQFPPPLPWRNSPPHPHWGRASSLSRIHDNTQTQHTRYDFSGRVISPSQRPLPDNATFTTDRHAPGGFRTRNPSKRKIPDPRLRPRDKIWWVLQYWAADKSLAWLTSRCILFDS